MTLLCQYAIEIHGLSPVVLARQVPSKILPKQNFGFMLFPSSPLRGAPGLLFIYGLTPIVFSQEIIKEPRVCLGLNRKNRNIRESL
jgi:hypothetical protein